MVRIIDNRRQVGIAGRRSRQSRRKTDYVYYTATNGKEILASDVGMETRNASITTTTATIGAVNPFVRTDTDFQEDSEGQRSNEFATALERTEISAKLCHGIGVKLIDVAAQKSLDEAHNDTNLKPDDINATEPAINAAHHEIVEQQKKQIESLMEQLHQKDLEIEKLQKQAISQSELRSDCNEQLLESNAKTIHALRLEVSNFRSIHDKKLNDVMLEVVKWQTEAKNLTLQLETFQQEKNSAVPSTCGHHQNVSPEVNIASTITPKHTVYNGRFLFDNLSPQKGGTPDIVNPTPTFMKKPLTIPTETLQQLESPGGVKHKAQPLLLALPKVKKRCRIAFNDEQSRCMTYSGKPMKFIKRHGNQEHRCTLVIHTPIHDDDEEYL
jgi:Zn finger protein HypA/HybF involved in hydrogenase expression